MTRLENALWRFHEWGIDHAMTITAAFFAAIIAIVFALTFLGSQQSQRRCATAWSTARTSADSVAVALRC